jgi:hypothetical protein
MRFYTRQHRHYCGVDLHARSMYVCVLDREGDVLVSQNIASAPEPFLELIAPYREDLAVAAECMFTWYWLADLCAREGIVFVLGHALYACDPRRQGEERPHRCAQDRGPTARRPRPASSVRPMSLCL